MHFMIDKWLNLLASVTDFILGLAVLSYCIKPQILEAIFIAIYLEILKKTSPRTRQSKQGQGAVIATVVERVNKREGGQTAAAV